MLKMSALIAVCAALLAGPTLAADYKCADKATNVKLNDFDIAIKNRSEAISEMKDEIKQAGGSTEEHKKAIEILEQKLTQAKADREALLVQCNAN